MCESDSSICSNTFIKNYEDIILVMGPCKDLHEELGVAYIYTMYSAIFNKLCIKLFFCNEMQLF